MESSVHKTHKAKQMTNLSLLNQVPLLLNDFKTARGWGDGSIEWWLHLTSFRFMKTWVQLSQYSCKYSKVCLESQHTDLRGRDWGRQWILTPLFHTFCLSVPPHLSLMLSRKQHLKFISLSVNHQARIYLESNISKTKGCGCDPVIGPYTSSTKTLSTILNTRVREIYICNGAAF